MSEKYYMGIDTSAYTTSVALIDENDNIVMDLRKVLQVKKGLKGLRQQEAVFQHVNNLPLLIKELGNNIDVSNIDIISCSNKPRNLTESYMPVFKVGEGQATIISNLLKIKFKRFSHQEGHIGAGIMNNQLKNSNSFLCLQISGGTTELLLVNNLEDNLEVENIGGTLDISVGQLIDRIGVEVGLDFPCGKEMDRISTQGNLLGLNIPIRIKDDTWFNLSGMENSFKKLINKNSYGIEDILITLFNVISLFIYKIIYNGCKLYNQNSVLITGGVAANSSIRKYLNKALFKDNIIPYYPEAKFCTDNAIGIAYLGKEKRYGRR